MTEIRQYETTYIVTPDLSSEEYTAIVEKFNGLMKNNGCEMVNQEVWGFKKLAYPINRKNSGYYVYTEFSAPGEFLEKLEREYLYDERVMRHLTVKLDKHAVAFNKRRLEKQRGYEPAQQ